MKLQLVQAPHASLSTVARDVVAWNKKLTDIIAGMIRVLESCKDPEGVGLAAPQVGLSLRLFLVKPDHKSPISIYINPFIIGKPEKPTAGRDADLLEGCLSVKNVWAHVDRSPRLKIAFFDEKGAKQEKLFSGFEAHIIQHEIDHLNGILFTQRALEQEKTLYRMVRKGKKETFEEIEL